MNIQSILSEKKGEILDEWFNKVVETYPENTSTFLKSQKNQFSNPVGSTTMQGLEGVFDELLKKRMDEDKIKASLDPIVRIRAVQDFTPSRAAGFVLYLKQIVTKHLNKDILENNMFNDLLALYAGIDKVCLYSFDIFMTCREKIYSLKANEIRNRTFHVFEKAGLISNVPDDETGTEGETLR